MKYVHKSNSTSQKTDARTFYGIMPILPYDLYAKYMCLHCILVTDNK